MRAFFFAAVLALQSCATIVSKSEYPVTIESNPPGASMIVKDDEGVTVYSGKSPATLHLDSGGGYFTPARYHVVATLDGHVDGHSTFKAGFDGWYVGNIVFGGLIGLLLVDPLTGSMWQLRRQRFLQLQEVAP